MTAEVFSRGMKLLATYYGPLGGDKLDADDADKLVVIYWQGLQDLADGAFNLAIGEAFKRLRFWPRVAELREWAAPYRVPVLERRYNAAQIEESTVQSREEAKEAIARIAAGLDERFGDQPAVRLRVVPGLDDARLSHAEFERRRQRLKEQAMIVTGGLEQVATHA